ncbi:MAG: PEP-CTERM sorting domain-containing protein [Phenylobacterium sp.]|nr:PEP-CTERM sorting domain-containing protein [Phenylobacterium sp.]
MKFTSIAIAAAVAAFSVAMPAAAAVVDVGAQTDTFNGYTRGYYFTAPTAFTITGVYVPTDASSGAQSIEIVRFNSTTPPGYPGVTNDFSSLGQWLNNSTAGFISTNISVAAGDIIGVYGWRDSVNSYGASNYLTQIGGYDVTLIRSGFQHSLNDSAVADVWSEPDSRIGRVQFSYELGSAVPEPATWAMLITGFGLAGGAIRMRRRSAVLA